MPGKTAYIFTSNFILNIKIDPIINFFCSFHYKKVPWNKPFYTQSISFIVHYCIFIFIKKNFIKKKKNSITAVAKNQPAKTNFLVADPERALRQAFTNTTTLSPILIFTNTCKCLPTEPCSRFNFVETNTNTLLKKYFFLGLFHLSEAHFG